MGGSRSPGDLHRNATREGVSQGAGQQKRSQRRARDRADDASRLIPARARPDACKPETKGAPRRSKDTPGKGSCDRERYPWFVAQFWTESRNRWRCRFRAADPRPRRVLTLRIEWGARSTATMVIIKIAAVILVIAAGLPYVHTANWHPFMPYGFGGVIEGAAVVFFAVFGYDTLTTAAEEARDPQRQLPRAVLLSLGISLALYITMSLVLTGLVRYDTLNNAAPVAAAFTAIGLPWVTLLVSAAAVAGIASVMLAFMLGCARIWFAMSRDGLLPAWFAQVHPRFRTPHRPTLIAGGLTALVAGFFPIKEVAELVNIGTLSAFVIICLAVIVLRRTRPDVRRTFRAPLVPWIPLTGIGFSLWLLSKLPAVAWERFVVWMALGLLLYFSYGRRHSVLAKRGSVPFEGKSVGDAQSQ